MCRRASVLKSHVIAEPHLELHLEEIQAAQPVLREQASWHVPPPERRELLEYREQRKSQVWSWLPVPQPDRLRVVAPFVPRSASVSRQTQP